MIDTNNFRQIIEFYDAEGNPLFPSTRVSIRCSICCEWDLALPNDAAGDPYSPERHETYSVLRCGHAFGYRCITQWLWQSSFSGHARCPVCRQDAFCPNRHVEVPEAYDGRNPAADIVTIRRRLAEEYPGAPCPHGANAQGGIPRDGIPGYVPPPAPFQPPGAAPVGGPGAPAAAGVLRAPAALGAAEVPGAQGPLMSVDEAQREIGSVISRLPMVERASSSIAAIAWAAEGLGAEMDSPDIQEMMIRVHIVEAILRIMTSEGITRSILQLLRR